LLNISLYVTLVIITRVIGGVIGNYKAKSNWNLAVMGGEERGWISGLNLILVE
jgi:hypothetical protein